MPLRNILFPNRGIRHSPRKGRFLVAPDKTDGTDSVHFGPISNMKKDDFEEKFCQIEKTEEKIREKANEWIQEAKIAEKELDQDIIIYKRKVTYPKR